MTIIIYTFLDIEIMKKNKTAKVFAILALFGIVLSIVWTGILILTSWKETSSEVAPTLTPEKLQEIIKASEVTVWTGDTKKKVEIKIGTGSTK